MERFMPRALLVGLLLMIFPALATGQDPHGSIAGTVGFPGEEVPALRIYAIAVEGGAHYSVTSARKQTRFVLKSVPAGRYFVVAYPVARGESPAGAGGWTRFVPCGMSVQCKDHSLIPVIVTAGKTTTGVEVSDWYAPAGSLPPEPTRPAAKPAPAVDCAAQGSQVGEDACNLKAYQDADVVLNREYQRLMLDLAKAPRCRNQLRDAQRAWIRFRDEQCNYEGAIGAKGRTTQCLREFTTQRADYLTRQAPDIRNP
jgi:uncharacterized protein YecT (DUF1311 family)